MNILTVVWSNIAWLGCVYAAKWNISPFSLLLPLVSWWLLKKRQKISLRLAVVLLTLAFIGAIFDIIAIKTDLLLLSKSHIPLWLLALWLHFVTLLPLMAGSLGTRPLLSLVLGAILGPLTYHSGQEFGVLTMNGHQALTAYALFWAAYLPLSLRFIKRNFS